MYLSRKSKIKNGLKIILIIPFAILLFIVPANAQEIGDIEQELEELKGSLSDEVLEDMSGLGVDSYLNDYTDSLTISNILSLITEKIRENAEAPLGVCAAVTAVILICSVLEVYKDSLQRTAMKEVLGAVSVIAVVSALTAPLLSLIHTAAEVMEATANMMILYIPVLISLLVFSGRLIGSAGFYSALMAACQGVSQLSSRFISPMMCLCMALSVSSSLSDRIRLKGFSKLLMGVMRWSLVFTMTLFSAMLSLKSFIADTYDTVSTRAVRFSLSSFIPVVGAAVSEAYKSISGSVNLLRSGAGVFVIIAVAVTFLPVLIRAVLFLISVNVSKAMGEAVGAQTVTELLGSVSGVITVLIAAIVSVAAVFIVSTAMLVQAGGAS